MSLLLEIRVFPHTFAPGDTNNGSLSGCEPGANSGVSVTQTHLALEVPAVSLSPSVYGRESTGCDHSERYIRTTANQGSSNPTFFLRFLLSNI